MGIFDRFPYSSTHEMNLDFMLGKATEIAESLQEIDTHKEQAEQAAINAAQSAQSAAQAAQAAAGSQTAAGTSASQAAQHKADAEDAADRAEAASDLADEAVEQAQTAAENAIANAAATANLGEIPLAKGDGTWNWRELGYVTPQLFGAKADGETDDTKAIQDAVDATIGSNIKSIYFPCGTYLITKPILLPPGIDIRGEDRKNTIIYKSGNGVITDLPSAYNHVKNINYNTNSIFIPVLTTGFAYNWYRYITISNITLKGYVANAVGDLNGIRPACTHMSNFVISNVNIVNVSNGIINTMGNPFFLGVIRDTYIAAYNRGISMQCNLVKVDNPFVEFTTEYAIYMLGNCTLSNVGISNAHGIMVSLGAECFIDVVSFEDCSNVSKYFEITGRTTIEKISFSNFTTELIPSNCIFHLASAGGVLKVGSMHFIYNTTSLIPLLVRLSSVNEANIITDNLDKFTDIYINNSDVNNICYVNDQLQYKPLTPSDGMIFISNNTTNPEIFYNGGWNVLDVSKSRYTNTPSESNGLTYTIDKYGKVCVLTITDGTLTEAVSTNDPIFTIPSGYRPVAQFDFLDTYQKIRLGFNTSGNIILRGSNLTVGAIIRGSFTYLCV